MLKAVLFNGFSFFDWCFYYLLFCLWKDKTKNKNFFSIFYYFFQTCELCLQMPSSQRCVAIRMFANPFKSLRLSAGFRGMLVLFSYFLECASNSVGTCLSSDTVPARCPLRLLLFWPLHLAVATSVANKSRQSRNIL